MRGDNRTQKPYKKVGQELIYKIEITGDTFNYICKKLKVKRIGNKEINELVNQADNVYETTCCPTEPSNDPNDLD